MTPQQIDAMKLALGQLQAGFVGNAMQILREALEEHAMRETQRLGQEIEQEPVAWLLTDKKINSLQVDDIHRLIDRLKHAHHTDLCVRINGQDEWFEADWLKHMVRVTPPQRKPLTDEEIDAIADEYLVDYRIPAGCALNFARDIEAAHGIKGDA